MVLIVECTRTLLLRAELFTFHWLDRLKKLCFSHHLHFLPTALVHGFVCETFFELSTPLAADREASTRRFCGRGILAQDAHLRKSRFFVIVETRRHCIKSHNA